MAYFITQLSLWVLRLAGGYILVNDLEVLHLPDHLDRMLYWLYVGLTLWKFVIVYGKVRPSVDYHKDLKNMNMIIYCILTVGCLLHFVQTTKFIDGQSVFTDLGHCLLTVALLVAGEKLFDAIIDTHPARQIVTWKAVMKILRLLFFKPAPKTNSRKLSRTYTPRSMNTPMPPRRRRPPRQEDRNLPQTS